MPEPYPSLAGKRALITGATSGHGQALAMSLARLGAECVLLGRNRGKCEKTASQISKATGRSPEIVLCDMSSMNEIRRAADEIMRDEKPLHMLINNAGIVNQHYRESADGIEETFAVNYLAMYLFTTLLLKKLKTSAPARIVNVSSDTHRVASLDLNDPEGKSRGYSFMGAYGRSKLAIVYFTIELATKLAGTGVTVNAVDPGPIASGIADKPGLIPAIANAVIQLTFPSPERASRTALHLAASPELEGKTGGYYRFMKKKEPKTDRNDSAFGEKLMEATGRMTGFSWNGII
ncbi:MAG TPA: SDR family NAD(P)-dependent oxidoreductase [Spirochaetota bacterium]|nr:SDR family NAD(P)-dependent oxidoreductase [Spirochaetota bacterium]HPI90322.1 SDR family NAD(P)-dependent oxidoreductase [Spirochaetota bacterium]HPR49411.1 SDR family NAD(P)-dependent oxidoreductase [Spirochaetota bacterium]